MTLNLGPVSLCDSLQILATNVWRLCEAGHAHHIDPNETTLTEMNLIHLATCHPREIAIQKFTPHQESRQYGADWEWWFTDGQDTWGMRVQAKKLRVSTRDYHGLDHQSTTSPAPQNDLLITAAQRDALFPLYCFYNWVDLCHVPTDWRCITSRFNMQLLGCTIASAHRVRTIKNNGKLQFSAIIPFAMPWHCLACCPMGWQAGPDGIRQWAIEFLGATDPPPTRLLDEVPDYVRNLYFRDTGTLEQKRPIGGSQRDDLAGAVVFRMAPHP
ncbi:MAG: DUF6615 family protein [Phycisphaerales bacterium JB054]